MKKLIFLLLFASSAFAQNTHLVVTNNIAEMKAKPIDKKAKYLVINGSTAQDGSGGLYYFDSLSTEAEDAVYLNVITPNVGGTGRYKRVNTRNMALPHAVLQMNGGVKTFIANGVVNASGEITFNFTYDNAAGTTPIFTQQPWIAIAAVQPNNTNGNDVVFGQIKSYANSFRQGTFAFARGGSTTLSLSIVTTGLNLLSQWIGIK